MGLTGVPTNVDADVAARLRAMYTLTDGLA